jgi:hypothetical protein
MNECTGNTIRSNNTNKIISMINNKVYSCMKLEENAARNYSEGKEKL